MKSANWSTWGRLVPVLIAAAASGACNDGGGLEPQPPTEWAWTDLGGPAAAVSQYVANQEPLIVTGSHLFLGTDDGVWRRPLSEGADWERTGLDGLSILSLSLTSDGSRIIAAVFDRDNEKAPTTWYSTDEGLSWTSTDVWPRGAPDSPMPDVSFPIHWLEPDPSEPDVVYGGMDADTLAVTLDGGATWFMTDGATSPNFGDYCVPHLLDSRSVLFQGCEIPLDAAWIGARKVIEDDRFQLPDFRRLYGSPEDEEMENRRVNAIANPDGRDDYLLVGVEGGLIALTSASGEWTDRSDITARWILRHELDDPDEPYPYIRAIVTLDDEGRHVLFGGAANGSNAELSLFETSADGHSVRQLTSPLTLHDPRIEQAWRLDADDVLLAVSEIDPDDPLGEGGLHYTKVYRLQRP